MLGRKAEAAPSTSLRGRLDESADGPRHQGDGGDQLDAGQRPQPDVTDCYDEARAIALEMERLITDIGQYGTMIEQATAALDEPIDSNVEYRDRQRQMYTDYQGAWDSQGRDSHRAFLRMINDPDQRAEFEADVAAVADALPTLDPALRKVMAGFFELVGHQIDEVERIEQRVKPAGRPEVSLYFHRLRHHRAELARRRVHAVRLRLVHEAVAGQPRQRVNLWPSSASSPQLKDATQTPVTRSRGARFTHHRRSRRNPCQP